MNQDSTVPQPLSHDDISFWDEVIEDESGTLNFYVNANASLLSRFHVNEKYTDIESVNYYLDYAPHINHVELRAVVRFDDGRTDAVERVVDLTEGEANMLVEAATQYHEQCRELAGPQLI